jgi:hypothetical protein
MAITNISPGETLLRAFLTLEGVPLCPCPMGKATTLSWGLRHQKNWDWCYDKEGLRVYHHKGHVTDIYTPSLVPHYTQRPNCWTRAQIDVPLEEIGAYCMVKQVGLGVYSVLSHSH